LDILQVFGYLGAILTGVILGLMGGGGALISIPILVYLFHIEASVATSYSLFLIAITASSGAWQNIRKKQVDYNAALYYGIPSVISIYAVRRWLMPNLPKIIFTIHGYALHKNMFILIILVIVMIMAAYKMITSNNPEQNETHQVNHLELSTFAILIGSFMGIVGGGGGFLMVPALVHFANTPVKKAVGTSLVLVAVNSFIGFLGDLGSDIAINWLFFFTFLFFSVAGVFIGHYLVAYIHSNKLRKYFGFFLIVVAIFIVIKEFTTH